MRFISLILLPLLLLGLSSLLAAPAIAQQAPNTPTIGISTSVGPPTTNVLVWGTGYDPYAAVDIYFDTTDLALVVTDGTGAFGVGAPGSGVSGVPIVVPKEALPGVHWITAVERYGIKAAQTQFMVRTDWAQFRFKPDHKGLNPYENVLDPNTVVNIGPHWSYQTGDVIFSSPTVANGIVYIGSLDGNLYALDSGTGGLRWKFFAGAGGVKATAAAVANGVLYIGPHYVGNPGSSVLYALNAGTGALLWKYPTFEIESAPTVNNGVVYIGDWNIDDSTGNLYALNVRTGALLWKYNARLVINAAPAVANGVVYLPSFARNPNNPSKLHALNANTGALLWTYQTAGQIESSPAVANGVVYVASYQDGTLHALNASTGVLLWKYIAGAGIISSPAVANGVVYVGSVDHYVYALNASTGVLLWKYIAGAGIISSPAVANGVVYFGSVDHYVYALNAATGTFLWKYATGDQIWTSSPAVANGVVYVGSADHRLYTFDLTGSLSPDKLNPPKRPDPALLIPNYSLAPSASVTSNFF
jgi:outer membrane protein assembly factor BamB